MARRGHRCPSLGLASFLLGSLLGVAGFPLVAPGHEDPGAQIEQVTREIAGNPKDPELYLRRSELYRSRGQWHQGIADLQSAKHLNPDLVVVELRLARLLLDADNASAALEAVDRFLVLEPRHPGAHLIRARILARLDSRDEAAREFTTGIDLARGQGLAPQPDDFLERARLLACDGKLDAALEGLDEGSRTLRGAVTLEFFAIDLEVKRRNWNAALRRLSDLEARANRKEIWMARRGEVLLMAGRREEAAEIYQAALDRIEELSGQLRERPATVELADEVREQLASLKAPIPPSQTFSRVQLSGHADCSAASSPL